MSLVTVYTTFSSGDAQLVRSLLDAANLHPVVAHELSSLSMDGYAMAAGGIQVQVPDQEAAAARELIQAPADPGESPAE